MGAFNFSYYYVFVDKKMFCFVFFLRSRGSMKFNKLCSSYCAIIFLYQTHYPNSNFERYCIPRKIQQKIQQQLQLDSQSQIKSWSSSGSPCIYSKWYQNIHRSFQGTQTYILTIIALGWSKEIEPIKYVYRQKEIYFKQLTHMIVWG